MGKVDRKLVAVKLTRAQWELAGVALKHWGFVLKCEAEDSESGRIDKAKYQKGLKMSRLAKKIRNECGRNSI